ncbi:hypothetical protein [Marinobacter sp.]|uniref:hypothetical protein n=1 Tax=Marinobacter sp. TaxID=50741 RepID=UPI003567E2DE
MSQLTNKTMFLLAVVVSLFFHSVTVNAEEPVEPTPKRSLEVAGISASSGEDDPRILYILPWQTPSLPRRPRAELNQNAPELMQPVSSTTLENHRLFRETMNPLVLEPAQVVPALDKP